MLTRPKFAGFLSFVEYKPDTNIAILCRIGHTRGRSYMKEGG
jgi:hypothetical protein